MKNVGLILVGAALATVLIFTTAQDNAPVANYSSSMSVERLASRMERFMKMHVEVVRNQMELNTSSAAISCFLRSLFIAWVGAVVNHSGS